MKRYCPFPLFLSSLISVLVSGCATQYGCKGMPDEPQCLSTTQAYQATNPALVEPSIEQDDRAELDRTVAGPNIPLQQPVPKIDDPTPIRTPSQVMRIWIAPWEDAEGDLMVSNYVYTELESRRWMIGKSAPTLNPSLIPLQIEQRPPATRQVSDNDDAESRGLPAMLNGSATKN
ncbi:conjugal transfer protein TraV [Methylomonas koyamae]|uniref:Conjugal transfer protein TraV n=1 Tax=Methylomonas koyamae TaxID=702114 RepID=A0A177NGT8_9GAMM|nr:TraV family lipoprotein [Methylomonas koyamae]OAI17091.1 conjugal transfer protein TraV [Methylomonas koyamae]